MHRQIPNILTVLRLIAAPLVAVILLVSTAPTPALIALIIFAVASATDWLDGYLARRWQSVSGFGRMLDPIADKLMVIIILAALMATPIANLSLGLAALIIITREIMVSGLREYMAKMDFIVHVTMAAKMKTTIQLIAIGFLIGTYLFETGSLYGEMTWWIGMVGIWLAALLTAQTGIAYFMSAARYLASQK